MRHSCEERPVLGEATSGDLAHRGLADLLPALEAGGRSGLLRLSHGAREGRVWFRDGRIVDSELGSHAGEAALYRLFRWHEGRFAFEPGALDRPERIHPTTKSLLLEGEQRNRAWEGLARRLPPLPTALEIDYLSLSDRLAEIPDEMNAVLKLIDGQRSIEEIFLESPLDDLVTAGIVARLVSEAVVRPASSEPPKVAIAPAAGGSEATWFAAPAGEGEGPISPRPRPPSPATPGPPRVVRFPAATRPGTLVRRPPPPVELLAPPAPPVDKVPPIEPPVGPGEPRLPPKRRRHPALTTALALLVLAALAIGVWASRSGSPRPGATPARGPAPLESGPKTH
jgi:Domain of unknown function (DUF4388)